MFELLNYFNNRVPTIMRTNCLCTATPVSVIIEKYYMHRGGPSAVRTTRGVIIFNYGRGC